MTIRRRKKLRDREGAAMLVVLMVLIGTTATATFAIHSTVVEMRAAGYSRRAMQTAYVAEGGAYASLDYIDAIGAQATFVQYSRTSVPANTELAPNVDSLGQEMNLLRIEMSDFVGGYDVQSTPIETEVSRTPSLGPRTNIVPTFTIDGTDLYRSPRMEAGRNHTGNNPMTYARVNLTSRGRVAPPDPTDPSTTLDWYEARVNARAMAEMGPFPQ